MASEFTTKLRTLYVRFEGLLATCRSPLLLLIRLYWGWQFAYNGWGKLHNILHLVTYFQSLNIPLASVQAPAIALLEFLGGILLILGLFSRLTALLLVCDMIVAFLLADRDALATIFSADPGKFYAADPFTFLCASLLIAVLGAGALSLDYLIAGRREIV